MKAVEMAHDIMTSRITALMREWEEERTGCREA
jgi:hypothetical protein